MVDFESGREERLAAHLQNGGVATGGITVRDYFAAKAMASIILRDETWEDHGDFDTDAWALSVVSYDIADAMMRARDQKPEERTPTVEDAFKL